MFSLIDQSILTIGLELSVLAFSLIATFKFFLPSNKDITKVAIVYLDEKDKPTKVEILDHVNDSVYLEIGYKLSQYEYKKEQNTLFLFIEHHHYNTLITKGNIRTFTFNHSRPIVVHETYKEDNPNEQRTGIN